MGTECFNGFLSIPFSMAGYNIDKFNLYKSGDATFDTKCKWCYAKIHVNNKPSILIFIDFDLNLNSK
ncbi:hypothetical protein BLOT_008908 [Blomia tropicalis]|nr:hypothetical protein BLOT_008908 [Blomia tropicalis]